MKRFPATSLKASYFVPSAFVLGVLFGALVFALPGGAVAAWLKAVYLLCIGFYLVVTLLSAFSFNPLMWLFTALGVWSSHVWYGLRFLQGLCARQAPCEFLGEDHARG